MNSLQNKYIKYTDSLFQINKITKKFDDRLVLDINNFSATEGERIAIIGPNGAGKTTILRILCALWEPTDAEKLEVMGYDLLGKRSRQQRRNFRSQIGFASNSSQLFGSLTIYENIEYAARLFSVSKTERKERIDKALALCRLQDRANDIVWKLSTGLRQRANIARCIVTNPKLLFLDEPTSGLDPVAVQDLYETVENLCKAGISIIMTTHIMQEVSDLCQRVIFLSGGKILFDGSPANLLSKLGNVVYSVSVPPDITEKFNLVLKNIDSNLVYSRPQETGEVVVNVFSEINNDVLTEMGVDYSRRDPQLRDAFFLLGDSNA